MIRAYSLLPNIPHQQVTRPCDPAPLICFMSQQQRLLISQCPITGKSSKEKKVCAKTRNIETTESSSVSRTQTFKCHMTMFNMVSTSSGFPNVHCDFSKKIKCFLFHHFVRQRIEPVFSHRVSGVSDSVKPEESNRDSFTITLNHSL